MHVMQSDIAAPIADEYDDGTSKTKRRTTPPSPAGGGGGGSGGVEGNGRRKRQKVAEPPRVRTRKSRSGSPDEDGTGEVEDDEKKRARGRPRLDRTDETAANRRRTQIRLAQRAYRNRKEEAIQTLENEVQELKKRNLEVNNAFLKLHEFVSQQGLLSGAGVFGQEFMNAAKRIRETAQKAKSDAESGSDPSEATEPGGLSRKRNKSTSPDEPSQQQQLTSVSADVPPRKVNPWGGYAVTHQPLTQAELAESGFSDSFSTERTTVRPTQHFEIVTYPTFENASFPFSMANELEPQTGFGTYFGSDSLHPHAESLPAPLPQPQQQQISYPQAGLRGPVSPAYIGTTFGRRLQLMTHERALALATDPNPKPATFARVFGFCMLFEPIESICERLRASLARERSESIDFWSYSFTNINGAGTGFPQGSAGTGSHLMGNQGTLQTMRPKDGTGMSTGPFLPHVAEAREKRLTPRMRILVPGFEDDFYDCEEVEILLHQRGVDIPPGLEYVTAEVDMAEFEDDAGNSFTGYSGNLPEFGEPGVFIGPSGTPVPGGDNHGDNNPPAFADPDDSHDTSHFDPAGGIAGVMPTQPGGGILTSTPAWAGGMMTSTLEEYTSLFNGPITISYNSTPPLSFTRSSEQPQRLNDPTSGDIPGGNSAAYKPGQSMYALQGVPPPTNMGPRQRKRVITLDIAVFIEELIQRAKCLGRSPAFRIRDINAAFRAATRNRS